MKGIFAWLATINKAWLGGVVAFVATFVVQQFFGVTLDVGTTDLVTNILWQLLVAAGIAVPTGLGVFAVPNQPTLQGVAKDADKLGLIVQYPSLSYEVGQGVLNREAGLTGDTAEDIR